MDKISQVPSLRNLCWKIDRDVWAKVESGQATTSWGREQTGLLIIDFLKEIETILSDGEKIKVSLRKTDLQGATSGQLQQHDVMQAEASASAEGATVGQYECYSRDHMKLAKCEFWCGSETCRLPNSA